MGRRVIIVLLYPQLNGSLPLPAYDAETMEAPPLTLILVTFHFPCMPCPSEGPVITGVHY